MEGSTKIGNIITSGAGVPYFGSWQGREQESEIKIMYQCTAR